VQGGALVRDNPYRWVRRGPSAQALVGATWTTENKLSLIAEAWHDGAAPSDRDWRQWSQRNDALTAQSNPAAPDVLRAALPGNLAWQAQPLSRPGLRRRNLFLRLSWEESGWQPALDILFAPADDGRIVTASLGWQGNRIRIDAVYRWYVGPSESVFAQLPHRRVGVLALTVPF
jgi:hypothetical protein